MCREPGAVCKETYLSSHQPAMKKNFLKEIQFSADCRSEMSVVMFRFTNMHCSRDISEKIHKKKYFCPLIVSSQVTRSQWTGHRKGEMLLFHITDKKSNNKTEVMAKLLQCYPLEIKSHASSTELFFLPWTPQPSSCPCTVTDATCIRKPPQPLLSPQSKLSWMQ